ncbi:MAG: hypothetical protein U5J99_13145 [Parvularculaceae bacterium]|nr:hypothetical protein [Parvularculaceae bacterium]
MTAHPSNISAARRVQHRQKRRRRAERADAKPPITAPSPARMRRNWKTVS